MNRIMLYGWNQNGKVGNMSRERYQFLLWCIIYCVKLWFYVNLQNPFFYEILKQLFSFHINQKFWSFVCCWQEHARKTLETSHREKIIFFFCETMSFEFYCVFYNVWKHFIKMATFIFKRYPWKIWSVLLLIFQWKMRGCSIFYGRCLERSSPEI